jgi:hypothetical protein
VLSRRHGHVYGFDRNESIEIDHVLAKSREVENSFIAEPG